MNIDWHSSSLTRFTIVDKDYKKHTKRSPLYGQ